ncbi:dTDP-glucose pyrophosphorylase [Croceivirga lutea]|uniref:sugar phosphate nucleotidyltransferase n=1 Tax=Croceivirga lutea TaxID=1775167 RepID=UPI00163B1782|nr:sugar phosphate nucleotidyltransferase [Croceivirga lutea]GGG52527.1 dTDP-glucose pyrophosphorylase [Croceivirga lutea]
MENSSLVIMAGGASSRMKRSLENASVSESVLNAAKNLHKSLIPLGKAGKPLLYYLFKNAIAAGIGHIYLITSKENLGFKNFLKTYNDEPGFNTLTVNFAIQHVPKCREKPLGTADALQQCLEQHPILKENRFTVCNGDNLYSTEVFKLLKAERKAPHAIIAYSGKGLGYTDEKLAKFAILDIDENSYLTYIIEKPGIEQLQYHKDAHGELRISMNIFNFTGADCYPFLVNCPINPDRDEKELPEAVRNMSKANTKAVYCYPKSEKLPDLTVVSDIQNFKFE